MWWPHRGGGMRGTINNLWYSDFFAKIFGPLEVSLTCPPWSLLKSEPWFTFGLS